MNVGWQELILIFLVLLLLFGPRMPEIGRSLGKGIKSFKDGLSGASGGGGAAGDGDEHTDSAKTGGADAGRDAAEENRDDSAGKDAGGQPSQGEHLAG